jgi:glutamyl-tRNA reductase
MENVEEFKKEISKLKRVVNKKYKAQREKLKALKLDTTNTKQRKYILLSGKKKLTELQHKTEPYTIDDEQIVKEIRELVENVEFIE